MKKGQIKLATLSILLLKDLPLDPHDERPFGHYLREELSELVFTDVPALDGGTLYVESRLTKPPAWLSFLEDLYENYPIFNGASTSAVIFTRFGERTFAIVFGRGRSMLRMGSWDDGFGLKTALGLIDRDRLKSVDKKTLSVTIQHARVQTALPGEVRAFGLDVEQDLLRAVAGEPADFQGQLGEHPLVDDEQRLPQGDPAKGDDPGRELQFREELIFGNSDTLTVAVRVRLRSVPVLLERYLNVFAQRKYLNHFPWIDKLAEVTSRDQIKELEARTNVALSMGGHSGFSLVVPEIVDWEEIGGFSYKEHPAQDEVYSGLDLNSFEAMGGGVLSVERMRRRQVYALNSSKTASKKRWQSYKCLYGEIQQGDDVFVLSGGKWYRVQANFVQQVNQEVTELLDYTLGLPPYVTADVTSQPGYMVTLKENCYCQIAVRGRGDDWKLIDRSKIFHGGGKSQIEFCDIVRKEGDGANFIFVKRYLGSKGGPGLLSHLFAQGYVAMSAVDNDKLFVDKVNEVLAGFWVIPQQGSRAIRATFAIVTPKVGAVDEILPFFSRLNLRNAARNLRRIGVSVSLCFVASDESESEKPDTDPASQGKPKGGAKRATKPLK